jgi:hypothetical protein
VLIAQGGVDGQKLGLTVALRYAASRPQFGDKPIAAYLTHQRRLLPALANTYALQLAQKHLKVCACAVCVCIGMHNKSVRCSFSAELTPSLPRALYDLPFLLCSRVSCISSN